MKVTELIQALQEQLAAHGDREVMASPEPADPVPYALTLVFDDDWDIARVL